MQKWLEQTSALMRELEKLPPGDRRNQLVGRHQGLYAEGNIRIVATEVDPVIEISDPDQEDPQQDLINHPLLQGDLVDGLERILSSSTNGNEIDIIGDTTG